MGACEHNTRSPYRRVWLTNMALAGRLWTSASLRIVPRASHFCSAQGTNVFKDGKGDVQISAETPDWLQERIDVGLKGTLQELEERDVEELSMVELKRLLKLTNRADIKTANELKLL